MFGGHGTSHLSDTWEWSGEFWNPQFSIMKPRPVSGHALAYDASRGRTLLFGGYNGGYVGDTWEWDGVRWWPQAPQLAPSARLGHAMASAGWRGTVVLFGGDSGTSNEADTWEWNGGVRSWTKSSSLQSPSARAFHALAFDSARKRIVLFGGHSSTFLNDTWEWDGGTWTQFSPPTSPPARSHHAMVYDDLRGRCVVFGGYNGTQLFDTWEWDGTLWVARTSAIVPPGRWLHSMSFHRSTGRSVLFGGLRDNVPLRDMWEYGPLRVAECIPFGLACLGSGGLPVLGAEGNSLPWSGGVFTARFAGLGSNPVLNVPFLVCGDSRSQWGSVLLPLELSYIGMPGCTLYCNPVVAVTLQNQSGAASWSVGIPSGTQFVGRSVFIQGGVLSPGSNAVGVVTSNSCELRIGAK